MNDPIAAREALIIEAIGEAVTLVDTVERMTAELQEAGREIARANADLSGALAQFEARVMALTERSKVVAVKHILARTDEAARLAMDAQVQAMTQAAQAMFRTEVDPKIQRLTVPLRELVDRVDRTWENWLTHAATAVVSSAGTWALLVWLSKL